MEFYPNIVKIFMEVYVFLSMLAYEKLVTSQRKTTAEHFHFNGL